MKKLYFLVLTMCCSAWALAQCTATLTFTVDGSMVSASVTGDGATSPSYVIDWGDGTQELSASGTHTYADGTYTMCGGMFDLNNPLGCSATDCYDIVIGQGGGGGDCMVNFSPLISGLNVAVNATGTGAATPVFSINWGDGSPIEATATGYHTYAQAGEYTICVLYTDSNKGGCMIENCQLVILSELQTDCTLTIEVTSDPMTGGTAVTATGVGAENPQYIIAWGDGSFPAIGSSATYTYSTNGSYNLCVTFLDVNNPLACNVTECAMVDVTIDVNELNNWQPTMRAYPIPTEGTLTVECAGAMAQQLTLEVLDLKGQLIQSQFVGSNGSAVRQWSIDVSHLAQGIYMLRANSEKGQHTIRFVK